MSEPQDHVPHEDHHMGDPNDRDESPPRQLRHEGERDEERARRRSRQRYHHGSKRPVADSSSDEYESSRKRGKRRATSRDVLTWRCEVSNNLIMHSANDCEECRRYTSHYFEAVSSLDHSLTDAIRIREENITSLYRAERVSFDRERDSFNAMADARELERRELLRQRDQDRDEIRRLRRRVDALTAQLEAPGPQSVASTSLSMPPPVDRPMASTSSQAPVSQDARSYDEQRAELDDQSDYGSDVSDAVSISSKMDVTAYPPLPPPGPKTQPDQPRTRLVPSSAKKAEPLPYARAAYMSPLVTSADWAALMAQAEQPGSWEAVERALKFMTAAQAIPAAQRSRAQVSALNTWRRPYWYKVELDPKTAESSSRGKRPAPHVASSTQPAFGPAEPIPHAESSAAAGARASGRRGKSSSSRMANPSLTDPPEMWAQWIHQNPQATRHGIVVSNDRRVSLRCLRGKLLVSQRAPSTSVNPSAERNRSRFLLVAAELFARPRRYAELIHIHGWAINPAPASPTRYPGSLDNLVVDDLARFFASEGITLAQADDAWAFAMQWLRDALASRGTQASTILDILHDVGTPDPATVPSLVPEWWEPPRAAGAPAPTSSTQLSEFLPATVVPGTYGTSLPLPQSARRTGRAAHPGSSSTLASTSRPADYSSLSVSLPYSSEEALAGPSSLPGPASGASTTRDALDESIPSLALQLATSLEVVPPSSPPKPDADDPMAG
jgi:hypothetical protein